MSDNEERWDSLPDEILTHIFLSRPIKSIIVCTSVSKTWNSLIQNPTFISTHLHHSYTNNHNLLGSSSSRWSHNQLILNTQLTTKKFTCCIKKMMMVSLKNSPGLNPVSIYSVSWVLVTACSAFPMIYSISTLTGFSVERMCLQLPHPNVRCATHTDAHFYASIGFGFDPTTNDYKVVRLLTFACTSPRTEVEIYSLSTGEWRMLSSSLAPQCALVPCQPWAFLNGALHWVAFRAVNVNKAHHFVLAFDLGDEVFREILLPELPPYTHSSFLCAYVSIYGNFVALFHEDYSSLHLNIWVMKHYGVVSSWTKALSLPMTYQGSFASTNYIVKAVGFTRNGRIVLEMNGGHLMSQDLKTQETKDLKLIGYNCNFVDAYVESLVLLDKAANGTITY